MADLIHRMADSVQHGVATIQAKSRTAAESSKINSQKGVLQTERARHLQELGAMVYMGIVQGSSDEAAIREKCSLVQAIDGQVKKLDEQLASLKEEEQAAINGRRVVGTCTCGTLLYEGERFCGACGKPVAATPAAVSATKTCSACGAEIPANAAFCPKCGRKTAGD